MALKKFLMVGFVVVVLVACGDDDSGDFATRPSGDSSSSDVILSGDSHEESSESKSSSSSAKSSSSSAKSSSSSVKSSSSVAYVEPCRTDSVDTCEYGTLTDERDGQTYKTVTIGTQIWMAENLNYAYTGVPYKYTYKDSSYTSDSTSWCYGDSLANCTKYGRLYTWAAAMDSVGSWSTNGKGCGYGQTGSPTYPVRGICPEGWHLPDTTEWHTLFTAVGGKSTAGKMLKSTSGWNRSGNGATGMDGYSFAALPSGYRENDGVYYAKGGYAYFWTSSVMIDNYVHSVILIYNNDNAILNGHPMFSIHSVRCIKD